MRPRADAYASALLTDRGPAKWVVRGEGCAPNELKLMTSFSNTEPASPRKVTPPHGRRTRPAGDGGSRGNGACRRSASGYSSHNEYGSMRSVQTQRQHYPVASDNGGLMTGRAAQGRGGAALAAFHAPPSGNESSMIPGWPRAGTSIVGSSGSCMLKGG